MAKFTKEDAMKDLAHARKLVNGFNLVKQFSAILPQDNPILYIFIKYIELQSIAKVATLMNELNFRKENNSKIQPTDISSIIQNDIEGIDIDIKYLAQYIFALNKGNINARYN